MNKLSATIAIVLGVMIGVGGCGERESAEAAKQSSRQRRPQDLLGDAYRFGEKDFQSEIASDKLFYVPTGDDDGMKAVQPNLKSMPLRLKDAPRIAAGYLPTNEGDNRGKVYFCDPDDGTDKISYVGDGWVVAESLRQREYVGFVYTDDEDMYVEGQNLKGGFYVLVGREKVPLANGSSLTMYAFVKFDSESNRIALEAYKYNDMAISAANAENEKRRFMREKFEKEMNMRKFHEELVKLFSGFSFPDFRSRFHFPSDIADVINSIVLDKPGTYDFWYFGGDRSESDFINAIKTNNWDYVTEVMMDKYNPSDDPVQHAKHTFRKTHLLRRNFRITAEGKNCLRKKYCLYVVNRYGRDDFGNDRPEIYRVMENSHEAWLPIDGDVYCIRETDVAYLKKFIDECDVDGFAAACKEREEYNKKLDKFNTAYYQELEDLFEDFDIPNVKEQLHCPASLSPLTDYIHVKDDRVLHKSLDDGPTLESVDFLKAIKKHDWRNVMSMIGYSLDKIGDPVQCANESRTKIGAMVGEFGRRICLAPKNHYVPKINGRPGMDEMKEQYCYCVVNRHAPVQLKWVSPKDENPTILLSVDAELYCVANEDRALFEQVDDAGAFSKAWHGKYREEHFGFGKRR